ncbi:MAG TPA: hypothetical protein VLA93_22110 [Pyrinomonadaceae bacterium]|nr:hypothetical protein [Pyrinomonadaceae bacterium]
MASKNSFSGLFGSARSPEEIRRRFIEAPLDASAPAALASALEIASVLTKLPDVFIASQNKELERLRATVGENDPRADALQVSIEGAEKLRATAQKGQARVQRVASAAAAGQKVFHGFVSAPGLEPMAGLTVRLTERKAGTTGTATTDEDGYFSMPLGPKQYGAAGTKNRDFSLSQRINRLFETRRLDGLDTNASTENAAAEQQNEESTVQIFRKKKLLHEDPIPVDLSGGSVYREYVVNEDESAAEDFSEFVWRKKS